MKHKIRNFMITLSVFCALLLVLNVVTLALLLRTNATLAQVRGTVDSLFPSITGTLGGSINNISDVVSTALKKETAAFSAYSYEAGAFDKTTRTVRVTLYATPKKYADGMAVSFLCADETGKQFSAAGVKDAEGFGFTAALDLPAASSVVSLSAAATIDGVTLTEQLDPIYGLADSYQLKPERARFNGSYSFDHWKDSVYVDGSVVLHIYGNPETDVSSPLLRIEKNGALVGELPFTPANTADSENEAALQDTADEGRFYDLAWKAEYPDFRQGDRFTATVLFDDSSGLHYSGTTLELQLGENGDIAELSEPFADFVIS